MKMEDDSKTCPNCKRDVSLANFQLHQVHCSRNIILCRKCDEPVPKDQLQDHDDEYHAVVSCSLCDAGVEKSQLANHQLTCPKRLVPCHFCDLELCGDSLEEHLVQCGSRTESCEKCRQYVQKRDLIQHEVSNCAFPARKPISRTIFDEIGSDENRYNVLVADNTFRDFYAEYLPEFPSRPHEEPDSSSVPNNVRESTVSKPTVSVVDNIHNQDKRTNQIPTVAASEYFGKTRLDDSKNILSEEERLRDMDADEALAWQLCAEDGLGDQVYTDIHLAKHNFAEDVHYGDTSLSLGDTLSPCSPSPNVSDDENSSALPCEFCNELFPPDVLIQHQSGCNTELAHLVPTVKDSTVQLNNKVNREPSITEQPQIVDNLSSDNLRNSPVLHEQVEQEADEEWLPCEFCEEAFPASCLLQHQAVCADVNDSAKSNRAKDVQVLPKQQAPQYSPGVPRRHRHQAPPSNIVPRDEQKIADSSSRNQRVLPSTPPSLQVVLPPKKTKSEPGHKTQPAKLKASVNSTNRSRRLGGEAVSRSGGTAYSRYSGSLNQAGGDSLAQNDTTKQSAAAAAIPTSRANVTAARSRVNPVRTSQTTVTSSNTVHSSAQQRIQAGKTSTPKSVISSADRQKNKALRESFDGAEELMRMSIHRDQLERIRDSSTGARPKHKPPSSTTVKYRGSVQGTPIGGQKLGGGSGVVSAHNKVTPRSTNTAVLRTNNANKFTGAVPKQKPTARNREVREL